MLENANVLTICAVLSLAVSGSVAATAQESPALKPYKETKVTFPGSKESWGVADWQITGNKTSIVYVLDYDSDGSKYRLIRYKFFANGKAASPITVLSVEDIWDVRLVWFDSANGPGKPPAGAAAGLLFAAYMPGNGSTKTVIAVAEVDKDGKPIGAFKTLLERTPSESDPFFVVYLGAGLGPDSVLLAAQFFYAHYGDDYIGLSSTKGYILETDFNGLQLGGLNEVPLPDGGNLNLCYLYSPYWTGSGWMMAAVNTKLKVYYDETYGMTGTRPIGNEIYVYSLQGGAGAPALKFKRRLFYKDNQQNELWTFRNAQFLDLEAQAQPGAKKAKKTLTFFFGHRDYIPENQVKMDLYTVDYYFAQVNLRGKRVGSSAKADIPQWDHKMPYDPDKELYNYRNSLSSLVPSGDGRFYASQHRSTLPRENTDGGTAFDCEHELRLYKLDPADGSAELIAEKTAGEPVGIYYSSSLRWFGKQLAILNYIDIYSPLYSYQYNYATMTP